MKEAVLTNLGLGQCVFSGVCLFLAIIYLIKKSLYAKIDKALNDVLGRVLEELAKSISILLFLSGIFIIGLQIYFLIHTGKWKPIALHVLEREILSFSQWLYTSLGLNSILDRFAQVTPLPMFLILFALLITLVSSTKRGGHSE